MKYIFTIMSICSFSIVTGQSVNWSNLEDQQRHISYLNVGYDYGVTSQIGYARKINWIRPLILSSDISVPMGKKLSDDSKARIGLQVPVVDFKQFRFSIDARSVYRRHQTELVKMHSFGSEAYLVSGIYRPKWHIAFQWGYDNAAATLLQHSERMQEIYSEVKDGWYSDTAGYFKYGIQASAKLGKNVNVTLQIGKTNARGDDRGALVPMYLQIGATYMH